LNFFCDDHVRRLARWLRAAGFDVAWEKAIEDDRLLRRCVAEDRVLLTLDRALAARAAERGCLLPGHDSLEQLRFVRRRYGLDLLRNAFSRCPVCNVPLEETGEVEVPERVRAVCDRFWRCPKCERAYWQGDHVKHMRERFREVSNL
jgi:uncharacterized protein with PIN domain